MFVPACFFLRFYLFRFFFFFHFSMHTLRHRGNIEVSSSSSFFLFSVTPFFLSFLSSSVIANCEKASGYFQGTRILEVTR